MRFPEHAVNAFYPPQALPLDTARRHPHGCALLLDALAPAPGSRVVELGAGSGTLLDLWGTRLANLGALHLVENRPELLEQSRERARGHRNIRVIQADADAYRAPWLADCVYFAYALTRTPDWVRALNNALAMLKPGGKLGIVDFYVAGTDQAFGRARHGALTRLFWTYWLRHDQVHLSQRHLAALSTLTEPAYLHEGQGGLPGVPLLRAPFYVFVGTRPARPRRELIADLWKNSAALP